MNGISKPTPLIAGGAFLAGLALGAIAGAKLIERKLSVEFEGRLVKETNSIRVFYGGVNKKKYATAVEAAEDLVPEEAVEALNAYQGTGARPTPPKISYEKFATSSATPVVIETETEVRVNVFDKPAEPLEDIRIVSLEEFNENDGDYIQNTLTYFEKDRVLVDEKEEKIEDIEKTIGEHALLNFGVISEDPNVVYVRNDVIKLDFEICRSPGSYVEEVLGMVDEGRVETVSERIRRGG